MQKTNKGKFITFEGGEGGGKSTQLLALANWLKECDISVATTREPGGTPSAELIRKLLVEGEADRWQPLTEVLLNYAARNEHIKHTILPALDSGTWVLSDRFYDSTIAYQVFGHGLDYGVIRDIHALVIANVIPDLTFLFDVPVDVGLKRAKTRAIKEDRYEQMDKKFHNSVQSGFLKLAKAEPDRFIVLDATLEINDVTSVIVQHVVQRFKL